MKKNITLFNKKVFKYIKYNNSNVFYLKKKNFLLLENISDLILLGLNKKKDLKICMHSNIQDKIHNMINFLYKKKYYYAHSHNKDEIYHFIKGKLKVILLDKKVQVDKIIILDKKNPIIRIKKHNYHLTIPVNKFSVFHEIKQGPFLKKNTKFSLKKYFA
jgi:cupin fold WbuC family metalloprotein